MLLNLMSYKNIFLSIVVSTCTILPSSKKGKIECSGPYSQPAALDNPNENPMDIPITMIPARDKPICQRKLQDSNQGTQQLKAFNSPGTLKVLPYIG